MSTIRSLELTTHTMYLLSPQEISQFCRHILRFYAHHGRHELPWRQTTDPYHILVSEVMLQQTQVERVIPKYLQFLQAFPTIDVLAQATIAQVLQRWQGLGYNRRGLNLHKTAQEVVTHHQGQLPQTYEQLISLPGIGPYTASAVLAFAFNQAHPLIETNVRTIYLYHFFPGRTEVSDAELLPLVQQTLEQDNARQWYAALMDYGSYLKSVLPNPSRQSKHHTTQSTFQGSLRQVRGEIIRLLAKHQQLTEPELLATITSNSAHLTTALTQLKNEGMITQQSQYYHLPK